MKFNQKVVNRLKALYKKAIEAEDRSSKLSYFTDLCLEVRGVSGNQHVYTNTDEVPCLEGFLVPIFVLDDSFSEKEFYDSLSIIERYAFPAKK